MASPFNFWTHLKFTDSKFYIAPLAIESVCSEGNNEIIIKIIVIIIIIIKIKIIMLLLVLLLFSY
jgi:hypothetical protein